MDSTWRITRSGGFAGAEESIGIHANGTVTIDSFLREARQIRLPEAASGRLHEAVDAALMAAKSESPSAAQPDRYVYVVEGNGVAATISEDAEGAARTLISMVDRLLDSAAP